MFIKLSENLEKTLPLKRVYKAQVIDNADPEKLGRVKVNISGIFEGDAANLPWVYPRRNDLLGGKSDSGRYAVPEIDSYLEVRFPTEDIYSPFYYGYWEDANTHLADFDTDYPDTYGWVDSNGTKCIINKKQMSLDFTHVSGIEVSMDKDGNLNLTVPKDMTEAITGNKTVNVTEDLTEMVEGDSMEAVTGDKMIGAENVLIESSTDTDIIAGGNLTAEATMNAEISAQMEASLVGQVLTKIGDPASPTQIDGALVTIAGLSGTVIGSPASPTNIDGAVIALAGGGPPVARVGDAAIGIGVFGVPVSSSIVSGSPKVTSG